MFLLVKQKDLSWIVIHRHQELLCRDSVKRHSQNVRLLLEHHVGSSGKSNFSLAQIDVFFCFDISAQTMTCLTHCSFVNRLGSIQHGDVLLLVEEDTPNCGAIGEHLMFVKIQDIYDNKTYVHDLTFITFLDWYKRLQLT